MDAIGLQTLRNEMLDDQRVVGEAYVAARARFSLGEEVGYEACAHHLCRLYNGIEQMGMRVAKAFENNIDDEQGWHSALLQRLTIAIDGVRPALLPMELKQPMQELKGFRHVFVHAYELTLDPEKLALLLKYAGQVTDRLPDLVRAFITRVAEQQGIGGGESGERRTESGS